MENQFIVCCALSCPSCLDYVSLVASIFATFISIGYWTKPKIRICIYTVEDKYKVKVVNRNFMKTSVKDVFCEIALSETETFKKAHTLELKKDHTVVVKACPEEYVFFAIDSKPSEQGKYSYIRARIMAPNFIGVKKVFEKVVLISKLPQEDCIPKSC